MKKSKHIKNALRACDGGFSLIEITIALVVAGLITAAVLYTLENIEKQERLSEGRLDYYSVADAMAQFVTRENRFPCPAPFDTTEADGQAYGREMDCRHVSVNPGSTTDPGNCNGNAYCVAGTDDRRVRIGTVPFRTLGIELEDIVDPYGNRLMYAVTEEQTVAPDEYGTDPGDDDVDGFAGPDVFQGYDQGSITLNRTFIEGYASFNDAGSKERRLQISHSETSSQIQADPLKTDADFVVFSTGRDGRGGYTSDGQPNGAPCSGAGRDVENCDMDDEFELHPLTLQAGDDYFDDTLIFSLWEWLYVWAPSSAEPENLFNQYSRFMAIGNADPDTFESGLKREPQNYLHVFEGNLRVEDFDLDGDGNSEGGRMLSNEICDRDGENCFPAAAIAGEEGEAIECKDDEVLVGVKNGAPVCKTALGGLGPEFNGGCSGNAAITGISVTSGGVVFNCFDPTTQSGGDVTVGN